MYIRDARIGLANKTLRLKPGAPALPVNLWSRHRNRHKPISECQRRRLSRAMGLALVYLREHRTATDLAQEHGMTYQAMREILTVGIDFLVSRGWLVPRRPRLVPSSAAESSSVDQLPGAA